MSRFAYRDLVGALGDAPVAGDSVWPVETCQQPRIGGKGHSPGFARLQGDALEPEQAQAFLARGSGQVELGYVGTGALAGVGNGEGGSERVTALGLEIAVLEGGVAQAVTEGAQRRSSRTVTTALTPMTLTSRENRSSSVICSSVARARASADEPVEAASPPSPVISYSSRPNQHATGAYFPALQA